MPQITQLPDHLLVAAVLAAAGVRHPLLRHRAGNGAENPGRGRTARRQDLRRPRSRAARPRRGREDRKRLSRADGRKPGRSDEAGHRRQAGRRPAKPNSGSRRSTSRSGARSPRRKPASASRSTRRCATSTRAAEAAQDLVAKLTGAGRRRRGAQGSESGAQWLNSSAARCRHPRDDRNARAGHDHHEAPSAFGMTAPMFIGLAMIVVLRADGLEESAGRDRQGARPEDRRDPGAARRGRGASQGSRGAEGRI